MEMPIIIDNRGDVLIFDNPKAAESYLEPIDVRNEEYVAYDAKGRLLHFTVQGNRVAISLAETEPTHKQALQNVLVSFFTRIGLSQDWVSQASLEQLVAKSLDYKTQ